MEWSIALCLLATAFVLYLCYLRLLPKPIPGIPYNEAAVKRLLGDIPSLLERLSKGEPVFPWIMEQTVIHNSPIVQLFLRPFSKPWILIADHRESQDILLRRTREFDRSDFAADLFEGLLPEMHNSMKSKDDRFRRQRNLVKDLNSPGFLYDAAPPQAYTLAFSLVKLWSLKEDLGRGCPFDAAQDVLDWSIDTLFAQIVGPDSTSGGVDTQVELLTNQDDINPNKACDAVNFIRAPYPHVIETFHTLTETLFRILNSPLPRLHHWLIRQLPPYRRARALMDSFILDSIEKATQQLLTKGAIQKSMLDHILQRESDAAQKKSISPDYKSRKIMDEIFGFLIGGHDTTSTTLIWGFKYLSDNQDVQRRLRTQLLKAYFDHGGRQQPTVEQIVRIQVPYLDAVLEEFTRVACVIPFIPRVALVDTAVLGHRVPKGTEVLMFNSGPDYLFPGFQIADDKRTESARSAKYQVGSWNHNDMQTFTPERWIKVDETGEDRFDPTAGPHLAFGLGPRGCLGRKLAYVNMRVVLVMVILNFELLKLPEELNSHKDVERMTRQPKQFFLRLRSLHRDEK